MEVSTPRTSNTSLKLQELGWVSPGPSFRRFPDRWSAFWCRLFFLDIFLTLFLPKNYWTLTVPIYVFLCLCGPFLQFLCVKFHSNHVTGQKEICLMAWAVDKIESNFLRWSSTWGARASHPKCPTSRIFPTTLWKKISTRDSTCRLNHLTSEWSIFPRLQTSYYCVPLLMRESHFECGHKDCSGTTETQQSNFIFLLAA